MYVCIMRNARGKDSVCNHSLLFPIGVCGGGGGGGRVVGSVYLIRLILGPEDRIHMYI